MSRLVYLISSLCKFLGVEKKEILVLVDSWVSAEVGQDGMDLLAEQGAVVRVAKAGVKADVRVMQAALAAQAYIISNDK